MLVLVYAIVCGGALSASFLAFYDEEVFRSGMALRVYRVISLVVFVLCWFDPLRISTVSMELSTGIPMALSIVVPVLLLVPFFYSTWVVFTDRPLNLQRMTPFLGMISGKGRFHAPSPQPRRVFPSGR
jgi:membrane-anchored protein YejM (alkaline phosphatase superfamily)